MRFDDRLATVLRQPAGDVHDRAVRWRQLVDLIARGGPEASGPVVDQAMQVIRADRDLLEEDVRAAAARAIAGPLLPFALVRYFVGEPLSVSAPVLATIMLSDAEWRQLASEADEETRRFISTLRPGLDEEPKGKGGRAKADVETARAPAPPAPVRTAAQAARAAEPGEGALFRWECDWNGAIDWVEGAIRGPLIGRSIARAEGGEGVDREVERAFAMRWPFQDGRLSLELEGPLAGDWRISGMPAFSEGRFAGYRGVAVRESRAPATAPAETFLPSDPDALRELVHELRTPLNAIVGFAEIIEGQYFGPAEASYRERAADIVAQARLLLTAIEDLDFAARLQARGGFTTSGAGADVAGLVSSAAAELQARADERNVKIQLEALPDGGRFGIEPELAKRLIARFLGSLVETAAARATLHIGVTAKGGWRIEVRSTGRAPGQSGLDLRLIDGLARVVGGSLDITGRTTALTLPAA